MELLSVDQYDFLMSTDLSGPKNKYCHLHTSCGCHGGVVTYRGLMVTGF